MHFTLGDIADMLKQLYHNDQEIQRLKLHIQELEEALGRRKESDATATGERSGDGRE